MESLSSQNVREDMSLIANRHEDAPHLRQEHAKSSASGAVGILVCTFQGAKFLRRQLETIVAQSYENWRIFVSDDGSDDATLTILNEFRTALGEDRLHIYQGPRSGFARNFFSLIAREDIEADYYAFADQDDEWDVQKLQRAVSALAKVPGDTSALYGSRSELINANGANIGYSRLFTKPSGFTNALVQNMVTGNTLVLNKAAMHLLRRAGTDLAVSAHDWWAYLLVTGHGGVLFYDTYPTLRYRQHGLNLYGANVSWHAHWKRVVKLFSGDFREWNSKNIAALRHSKHLLNDTSQQQLELFERARQGAVWQRLYYLFRSGVYRQTWDGQLGLWIAAIARRI